MYLILIYIIIAFTFYLFVKDIRKKIEGQTLESYNYLEFQPIINDDMMNNQLQEHINKYSKDIDKILKNIIDDENISQKTVDLAKTSGKSTENILYDIYVRDVLGELNETEYNEQTYNNYLNNYLKYNKEQEILKNVPYSKEQIELLKNKYKKDILYSNEYEYMDIDDVNEKIKNVNDEMNKVNGSYVYIKDGTNFPGFISKSDDKVINNMVDNDSEGIVLKNLEFCCDYSMLNMENQYILSKSEIEKVNNRLKDILEDSDGVESERHYEYNYPYYTYMKGSDRKYDGLYLNYNKNRNIGSINL
jgi:hypothetical protein